MPFTFSLRLTEATTQNLLFGGWEAGDRIQVQIANRGDFAIDPVQSFIIDPVPEYQVEGLNQQTKYFYRARLIAPDGSRGAWSRVHFTTSKTVSLADTSPAQVMIKPAMIVVPDYVYMMDTSETISGYPVSNLLYDAPTAWRAQMAGSKCWFTFQTGAPFDTLALLASNASEASIISLSSANTPEGLEATSPKPQRITQRFRVSTGLPQRRFFHCLMRLPSLNSFPFHKIEIEGALPGAVFQAQHLIVGRNRSTKNMSVGKSETPVDMSRLERTRGGLPDRALGARLRQIDFDLAMLTEEQFETQYADLWYRVGTSEPVLVVPNSKPGTFLHDRIAYGAIRSMRSLNPASPRFTQSLSIESLI